MPDAAISAAGLRIMKLLVGNAPQTMSNLVRAIGVTRTAITEQLDALIAAGFVEQETQRLSGRGRPRHLYKATSAALALLFAKNLRLITPVIWRAIGDVGGPELTANVMKQVTRILAEHYNDKITAVKPADRLRQFMDLLAAEGGLIEIDEDANGQVVIHRRSCPFITIADPERGVCGIDLEILSAVASRPVRQTACRLEGAPCCTFEIVDS
jgi:DeoR family transcriptional regulator, suf operon transcriptional repressor